MTDVEALAAFINTRLDQWEQAAKAATQGAWVVEEWLGEVQIFTAETHPAYAGDKNPSPYRVVTNGDFHEAVGREDADHIALNDPPYVLADIAAKRRILTEALSWQHTYVDGDTWFSCAQAASRWDEDEPGSGCADEGRAGGPCDCGLADRQARILLPLAEPFSSYPDYPEEWRP